jgi:hypothetical protein
MEIYKWQAMYKDIKKILSEDFILYKFVNHWIHSSDVIFINKNYIKEYSKLRYIYTCLKSFLLYPEHILIAYTPCIWWKILRIIKSIFKSRLK